MGTNAPVRREIEIPIVEPYRLPAKPKRLPEVDPERIIPIVVPQTEPVREPVRILR